MILTEAQFRSVAKKALPGAYTALADAASKFNISGKQEECTWLGQMAVESDEFSVTKESLNYSVQGLIATFGTSRISVEQANRVGRIDEFVGGKKVVKRPADQDAIANIVYGGAWGAKNLGNIQPYDGALTIGRGFKQLTGRANYERAGLAIHGLLDYFIKKPQALEKLEDAANSAAWFWVDKKLKTAMESGGIKAVTMKVTGWTGQGDGKNVGLDRRVSYTLQFLGAAK